jgi:hypothetical protein
MATRGWTWRKLLLAAGLCIGAWMVWHRLFDDDQSSKRLVNQVWIERMPRDERDQIHGGVLVEHDGDRVGVVGRGSRWRIHQDLFLWRLDGDHLRTRFPQDNTRYDLQVKTWECEGKAPKPFQLCLELRRGQRVLRFYSHKDWVIRPHGEVPAELIGIVPDVTQALAAGHEVEVGEGAESEGLSPFEAP